VNTETHVIKDAHPTIGFPEFDAKPVTQRIVSALAVEVAASEAQIKAAVALLDEGATVPFIARYRKEVTGGLDDTQLRLLDDRLRYRRELEERRATVVHTIAEQGKLTEALKNDLLAADTLARIEDLYAPYKLKRRTKAMIARAAGLETLALLLLAEPLRSPEAEALAYVGAKPQEADPEKAAEIAKADSPFSDVKAVLNGARDILTEKFGEDANLLALLRELMRTQGFMLARVIEGKAADGTKFSDYFEHTERFANIPSHRTLAMFRGRSAGVLRLDLSIDETPPENPYRAPFNGCEGRIAVHYQIAEQGRPADKWLLEVVRWSWRTRMSTQLQLDLFGDLRERAEQDAIKVFGSNLKDLLLAAPAGAKATLGLDPGLRTGVKCAVVDATGKVLLTDTVFPHAPRNDWDTTIAKLAKICASCQVNLIAIGNGTASRETEQLARDLIKHHPELKLTPVVVSEAGASVYSASALAAAEFPELDVSLRGAVSIARRLQDPLAELVKIDPKSIGVGQYQHDVNAGQLGRALDAVVEDCVNAVGVDLNMASAALLSRVSGLSNSVAKAIVQYRDNHGAFASRENLKKVPKLGERSFEQCAGFLRISQGENPLDASAVHPEAYPIVEKMLARIQTNAQLAIGNREALGKLNPAEFVDERFGLPTITDILKELEKPGRDPRPEFKTARFADGVSELKDLKVGMLLEGVVTNVTAFGAFIDIGVHQDGLAHISELADRFVKDPRDAVKTGQIVKARVLEIDLNRRRVALSLKTQAAATPAGTARPDSRRGAALPTGDRPRSNQAQSRQGSGNTGNTRNGLSAGAGFSNNALADAMARAKEKS
jgi:protein Tex